MTETEDKFETPVYLFRVYVGESPTMTFRTSGIPVRRKPSGLTAPDGMTERLVGVTSDTAELKKLLSKETGVPVEYCGLSMFRWNREKYSRSYDSWFRISPDELVVGKRKETYSVPSKSGDVTFEVAVETCKTYKPEFDWVREKETSEDYRTTVKYVKYERDIYYAGGSTLSYEVDGAGRVLLNGTPVTKVGS